MSLAVERYRGDEREWDEFAATQAGTSHCHRYGWKSVIEGTLGHEFIPLCARGPKRELRGILPLVSMRSMVFGRYLASMPFLNSGGPLGAPGAVAALSASARDLADDRGVDRLELRSRIALPITLDVSHHKIGSVLELPRAGADALSSLLPSKLRSQVRRSEREGMTVDFGHDQIAAFHQVFSTHMTRLGTPTYPLRFFEAIAREFGEDAWIGCVRHEGKPVAAGFALCWKREVEMTWASSLVEHKALAPNMLLYWSFLRRAAEHELACFDFGRSTPGSGTHRFKQQWGARDVPLWWYSYAGRGRPGGSISDDLQSVGWGPRLWKKLPVPIARIVGPPIRRAIPL
jgi:serine/alanine adding enzyme